MNIELHIEQLVLHGFEAGDREAIGEAVRAELVRLLTEKGLPASLEGGLEIGKISTGVFHVGHGESAGGIGEQVASTVHGGLTSRITEGV